MIQHTGAELLERNTKQRITAFGFDFEIPTKPTLGTWIFLGKADIITRAQNALIAAEGNDTALLGQFGPIILEVLEFLINEYSGETVTLDDLKRAPVDLAEMQNLITIVLNWIQQVSTASSQAGREGDDPKPVKRQRKPSPSKELTGASSSPILLTSTDSMTSQPSDSFPSITSSPSS